MAGQVSLNLKYYPTPVKWWLDERVDELVYRHKAVGFMLWHTLRSFAFDTSYYFNWTTISKRILCEKAKVTEEQCDIILADCFELGLFDRGLFDDYHIITSYEIQEGYCKCSTRKTKVLLVKEHLLIPAPFYNKLNLTLTNIKGDVLPIPKDNEIAPRLASPVVFLPEELKRKTGSFNPKHIEALEDQSASDRMLIVHKTEIKEIPPVIYPENTPNWLKDDVSIYSFSYDEIKKELLIPYDERPDIWKETVPKDLWTNFVQLNKYINENHPRFRSCQNQLTLPQYKKLKEAPLKCKGSEIKDALFRLSGKPEYLEDDHYMIDRIKVAIAWVREKGRPSQVDEESSGVYKHPVSKVKINT